MTNANIDDRVEEIQENADEFEIETTTNVVEIKEETTPKVQIYEIRIEA